jgi:DNA-binding NtrC family response regulator
MAKKPWVLLVESDAPTRMELKAALENAGHGVYEAQDLVSGLSIWLGTGDMFDWVISNAYLRGGSGTALRNQVKKSPRAVNFIMTASCALGNSVDERDNRFLFVPMADLRRNAVQIMKGMPPIRDDWPSRPSRGISLSR